MHFVRVMLCPVIAPGHVSNEIIGEKKSKMRELHNVMSRLLFDVIQSCTLIISSENDVA